METPPATMMALLIAVIFIGVALVFAAGLAGKFPGLSEWLDKLFGGLDSEKQDYNTAVGSTEALICAINSVSQGSQWSGGECSSFYTSSMAGLTGYLTLGERGETKIECKTSTKTKKEKAKLKKWPVSDVDSNPDPTKYFDCATGGGLFGCYYCERGTGIPGKNECEYTASTAECDVKNFYLPQSFEGFFTGKPKEYISGYGDPAFIVYFQQFPKGEDAAWSSFSEWFRGVGTLLFIGMCASGVLKPITKPLGALWKARKVTRVPTLVKGVSSTVKTKIESNIKWLEDLVSKVRTGKTVWKKTETRINDVTTRIVFTETRKSSIAVLKDVLKEESVAWFKANWKPAMQNAMVKAGILSTGAYAAARIDSEVGKLVDEYPSSIVFARPLKKSELPFSDNGHNLVSLETESSTSDLIKVKKPVVLKKSNSFTFLGVNSPSSFYLAAPCHADLKVEEKIVICDGYTYDSVTGMVTCNVKDVKSDFPGDMRQCGELDLQETTLNKQMFKDTNGDGKWDEFIFNGDWELGKFLYVSPVKEMTFKDENHDGVWDWIRVKDSGITRILKSSAFNGFFDLADLDNDGRFETKFEPNPSVALDRVKIFKDEDGDGTFEKEVTDQGILDSLGYKTSFGLHEGAWKGSEYGKYLETAGSPYLFMMRFADFDDDGKWDWYMNYDSGLIYVDYNSDGVWDFAYAGATEWIENGYWDCEKAVNLNCLEGQKIDISSEGIGYTVDNLGKCAVEGIVVSVDKSEYKDDEHNFCYTGESGLGIALMAGSLAVDAFAKRIPSPLTWVASTVADCGLAYFHMKSEHDWPG